MLNEEIEIEPPQFGQRWLWPVKDMKPGQRFVVDQQYKPHGETVNTVRVLAHRYGKRVSVTEHPGRFGYTLIECREWDDVAAKKHVLMLDWRKFEKLMDEHGAQADDRMISTASYSWPVSWKEKPRMEEVRLDLWDGSYTVRFEEDRVVSQKHSDVAEPLPLPSADKGDMFGTMFANEEPVAEEARKLLDD